MNKTNGLTEKQMAVLKHFILITGKKFEGFGGLESCISDLSKVTEELLISCDLIMDWLPVLQDGMGMLHEYYTKSGQESLANDTFTTMNKITLFFGYILKNQNAILMMSDVSDELVDATDFDDMERLKELEKFIKEVGKEVSP